MQLCLQSVQRAGLVLEKAYGPGAYEIWVVDNNSSDSSLDMLAEEFPTVRVIANNFNAGFSKANNQAIKQSNAEYVLLLNPDTVIPENCLLEYCQWMDSHPKVGALGTKMIDGAGKFLPESKRGFPSASTAFYKISGINSLFPRSGRFNKYYEGSLPIDKDNKVDILAGAFMWLRADALQKAGLLDEIYFMYGEDIDLSYSISLAGYEVWYSPREPIIHYKGESTKKGSLNYVYVFYRAMLLFAKKHLSSGNAVFYKVLIPLAIWAKGFLSATSRFIKALFPLATDFVLTLFLLHIFVRYWEATIKYIDGGEYPPELYRTWLPIYAGMVVLGMLVSGGYRKPYSVKKAISGALAGFLLLAVLYAFLPERMHFSRAILIAGSGVALLQGSIWRAVANLVTGNRQKTRLRSQAKSIIIVANETEYERVRQLLTRLPNSFIVIGGISASSSSDYEGRLGNINELAVLARTYAPHEIIFCAADIPFSQIISSFEQLNSGGMDFKIVPAGSYFIIGSSHRNESGDYYTFEENFSLNNYETLREKRSLDLAVSGFLLLASPLLIFLQKDAAGLFTNIISVIQGKRSWVGLSTDAYIKKLPQLKAGILNTKDELAPELRAAAKSETLDYLYAKNYSRTRDIRIILRSLDKLGVKGSPLA